MLYEHQQYLQSRRHADLNSRLRIAMDEQAEVMLSLISFMLYVYVLLVEFCSIVVGLCLLSDSCVLPVVYVVNKKVKLVTTGNHIC